MGVVFWTLLSKIIKYILNILKMSQTFLCVLWHSKYKVIAVRFLSCTLDTCSRQSTTGLICFLTGDGEIVVPVIKTCGCVSPGCHRVVFREVFKRKTKEGWIQEVCGWNTV